MKIKFKNGKLTNYGWCLHFKFNMGFHRAALFWYLADKKWMAQFGHTIKSVAIPTEMNLNGS